MSHSRRRVARRALGALGRWAKEGHAAVRGGVPVPWRRMAAARFAAVARGDETGGYCSLKRYPTPRMVSIMAA